MKKILISCICLLLLLSFCACGSSGVDISKIESDETYPEGPGSLDTVYTNFEELAKASSLIAEVEIQDTYVVLLDGFPQTHSTTKVLDILVGTEASDVIEVIEEGGATEKGIAVVGVPVMEAGGKYILFLAGGDGVYYITGAFQGKFIERDGFAFQQKTEDVGLTNYSPISIDAFKELTRGIK